MLYDLILPLIWTSLASLAVSSWDEKSGCGYAEICKWDSLALLQTSIAIQHKEKPSIDPKAGSLKSQNEFQSESKFITSGGFYASKSELVQNLQVSQSKQESSSSEPTNRSRATECMCCPATCNEMSYKLKLVHITKTGGSAMERWGFDNGFRWGWFWLYWTDDNETGNPRAFKKCPQHTPPQFFSKSNPYDGYDMFTIVKDPYARIISEFRCSETGFYALHDTRTAGTVSSNTRAALRAGATVDDLNKWVIERLRGGAARPPFQFGHMVPQHFYLYGKSGESLIRPENILRAESLDEDFAALKQRYNIVGGGPIQEINPSEMKRFNVTDLSEEARQLIEEAYSEDFDKLGYPKL